MDKVLAVILGGGRGTRLQPLTKMRAKPAVPIAGKFRLIDIPISNCINSDIKNIYILTQFNSVSLHRHINSTYKFDSFTRGFIEVLAAQQTITSEQWYQGTADAVRRTLPNLRAQNMDNILILAGDHLYQMDYSDFISFHRSSGADVTVAVKPVSGDQASSFGILKMDAEKRITDFFEKPPADQLTGLESETDDPSKPFMASMGIYVFNRGLLVRLLTGDIGDDFGRHIIPTAIEQLNVKAYEFNGYWEDIGTIKNFFHANLALTYPFPEFDLYQRERPIYTRARFLPASKIYGSSIKQTMICEGCIIENCNLEGSIVGIRSRISSGSSLKNTIMMGADFYQTIDEMEVETNAGSPIVGLGKNVVIENAIIDKNARIGDNVRLVNVNNVQNGEFDGYEVSDGIIVVHKNAIILPGTVF